MRSLGKSDLAAIAVGGVLGATVRWFVTRPTSDTDWVASGTDQSATAQAAAEDFGDLMDQAVLVGSNGIPVGTLVVNLVGCLLLGSLALLLARSTTISRRALLAAATGFCGSLTTFSTFAVELAARLRASPVLSDELAVAFTRTDGQAESAVVYLVASLLTGAFAFWLGRTLARAAMDRGRL